MTTNKMIRGSFLIAMFALLINGCDQTGTTGGNSSATNSNRSANVSINQANTVDSNANSANSSLIAPPANQSVQTPAGVPANAALKNAPLPEMKPQSITQSAPDDSDIETQLGANLVRIRTFKNNPRVSKVEETTLVAENKKVIKVYLKNGQVKEVGEAKIKDAMTETAANILKAIN